MCSRFESRDREPLLAALPRLPTHPEWTAWGLETSEDGMNYLITRPLPVRVDRDVARGEVWRCTGIKLFRFNVGGFGLVSEGECRIGQGPLDELIPTITAMMSGTNYRDLRLVFQEVGRD